MPRPLAHSLYLCLTLAFISLMSACTHVRPKTTLTCAGFDWWEAGRTDGVAGSPVTKLEEYRKRCESVDNGENQITASQEDLYRNGRFAGLIDYCTPQQGISAGRAGLPYAGVCPENMEREFISAYATGSRIRALETQDVDLEMRIDDLHRLLESNQAGPAVRAQLDQLRERRAKINTEISKLETDTAPRSSSNSGSSSGTSSGSSTQ